MSENKKVLVSIKKRPTIVVLGVFLIGVLIAATVWLVFPKGQQINTSTYQAVYLTNGQMYFGKLQNTDGAYLTIKSPYMPQSTSSPQDTASAIIKVKNQLWGPEDSIAIRSDQVSFWQNLRDDSKVTQAIKAKQDQ